MVSVLTFSNRVEELLPIHEEFLLSGQSRLIGIERFMVGLGFVESPYLVYRRHDHDHLHIHIITVGFDINGNTIKQSFMLNKCNRIRKELENEYGLIHASGRREWTKRLKSNQP